jgi:uncharacterized protein (DUF111 family)
VQTQWGPVTGKLGWLDGRPPVFSPEYDDCARVAREHRVPLREFYARAQDDYQKNQRTTEAQRTQSEETQS